MKIHLAILVPLFLVACTSGDPVTRVDGTPAPERKLEFVHLPISDLTQLDAGVVAVALDPMARSFVIHPELSPDYDALVAFARSASAAKRPVHATVWIRDARPKTPPPWPDGEWPFVIVRLADERDPRARS